jgi:hypothetical protein
MSANNSSVSLNQTTILVNGPYPTFEQLLNAVGYAFYLDYLWLYLNLPVNAIGVVFNLAALIVLQNREFEMRLYDYMRVYCANSFVENLISMLTFTANTPFILHWTNSQAAFTFFLYVNAAITNLCYFYGTALDILILLDRIGTFRNYVTKWIKLSPYKTSLIAFICCLAIDFPYFFVYEPHSLTANLNATFVQTIWYVGNTVFAKGEAGTIITFVMYAVRDILLLPVEIVLNILSVYLLKEYIANRAKLLGVGNAAAGGTVVTNLAQPQHLTAAPRTADNAKRAQSVVQTTSQERVSKPDLRLSIMVVIMCFLSILEHVFQILCVACPYFGSDAITFFTYIYLNYLMTDFKHAVNFFLFFIFNNKFRAVCVKFVKREQN